MLSYDRGRIKRWAKSQVPIIWKKRYFFFGLVAIAVSLYFFHSLIKMLFVMAAFILFGTLSLMYNRWVRVSLGVELIMMGTVITTVAYGVFPGMVVGFTSLFFAEVLTSRFTYSTFVSFAGLFVVVVVASRLEFGIMLTGMLMTLLYDAIIAPGYVIMGSSPWRTAIFVVTHLLFNFWMFAVVAPRVFGVVA